MKTSFDQRFVWLVVSIVWVWRTLCRFVRSSETPVAGRSEECVSPEDCGCVSPHAADPAIDESWNIVAAPFSGLIYSPEDIRRMVGLGLTQTPVYFPAADRLAARLALEDLNSSWRDPLGPFLPMIASTGIEVIDPVEGVVKCPGKSSHTKNEAGKCWVFVADGMVHLHCTSLWCREHLDQIEIDMANALLREQTELDNTVGPDGEVQIRVHGDFES